MNDRPTLDEIRARCALPVYSHDFVGPDRVNMYVHCKNCGRIFSPGKNNSGPCPGPSDQPAVVHASDCAVHNEPYKPAGPCNCNLADDAPTVEQLIAISEQQK